MANSRVQQESKMQQQHYGVNTHPVMTTIEQFRYRLDYTKAKMTNFVFKSSCIENIFLQEINIIPWVAI
jgi:hypothetical protein